MENASLVEQTEEIRAPAGSIGIIGWVRRNLFSTPFNSMLTLLIGYSLFRTLPNFIRWAFIDAVWWSGGQDCNRAGACWSVVTKNIRFILFGFYPYDQQWRPILSIGLLAALVLYSSFRRYWGRRLLIAWPVGLALIGLIMRGGIFGLTPVQSEQWSGICLTLFLSIFGLAGAYPFGVFLALGRHSGMPAIKSLSVVYIELIRGIPLISMLFMASVMFPLFLPQGITVNKILRAQGAIIMFTAAYIAEAVRGGLQAIPRGQYEAAESLGLNYYSRMRLIILPQALKTVIPPTVSILISAFKDTSLVVIIGLFDLLKTTHVTLSNPEWMGFSTEAYIFTASIYFLGCFMMSTFSRNIEKSLKHD